MGTQTLSLNWSNHTSNMSTVFQQLFSAKAFVDVTIVCDGLSLKAHKMVLSASSPLFRRLLLENPCQHPIIIMTDITYNDMEALLSFMYRGEIDVAQEKLPHFLRTAEKLKIKGLSSSDSNISIHKQNNASEEQITAHPSAERLVTSEEQITAHPSAEGLITSEEQITAHPSVEGLVTSLAEFSATNDNIHSERSTLKQYSSLEMGKDQRTSVKLEDSFEKCGCVDSEQNSKNEQCWRDAYCGRPVPISNTSATELAKSTISCLRHWEGLTNGKPSYMENQINDCAIVQQVTSTVTENLPAISDDDDDDLQEHIFPPSFLQQTMERTSTDDDQISKAEQAEEENLEFNKKCNFESSDSIDKMTQIENEKIDSEGDVLVEADKSQDTEAMDVQLLNSSVNKEPCQYNPHLACDVCKKSFEDLRRLCLHRRSHNCEQGPFTCTTCGKMFEEKSRFRCHLRTHSGKRPFSCSVCNKAFIRNDHLQDHMRIHSGEKPFSCAICDKKFITKGHLTIHSRSHTGEKPYVCDFCQKKFVKSSDLMIHLRVHTGEKPYTCKICGKRFSRTANLKTHAFRNHRTEYQPTTNWL